MSTGFASYITAPCGVTPAGPVPFEGAVSPGTVRVVARTRTYGPRYTVVDVLRIGD